MIVLYGAHSRILVVDFNLPKYSSKPMRPTLVHNRAFLGAICKNAVQFLGSLPVAGSEQLFHVDLNSRRKAVRRRQSCLSGWIRGRKADGSPRCPEIGQPNWYGYDDGASVMYGSYKVQIFPDNDAGAWPQLARSWQRIRFNTDGTYEKTIEW